MKHDHPETSDGITAGYLTGLIAEILPGTSIESVEIVDAKTYGQGMVSTAGRALLNVRYGAGSAPGLPNRLVLKVPRGVDTFMAPFYANEVAFYRGVRPELAIEAPRCFGADMDMPSVRFGLLLEDLTQRQASFPNVTQPVTLENIRAILDTVAALHAKYWDSPRFSGDLAWVETHVSGGVAELMNGDVVGEIEREIAKENFKREMVQRLRTSAPELLAGVRAVQRHQTTLPQTILHGDTHIGNTYLLPDGSGGVLDWQLTVRGYAMHDVNYLITTGLSIGDRRLHERELLSYYLDRLAFNGVKKPPTFDDAWREYRRTLVWGVYIGWLTTPVVNYGWEINLMNHLRLTTAFEDLETGKLVAELL